MANCTLAEKRLTARAADIRGLLKPLAASGTVASTIKRESTAFILGAYDGPKPLSPTVRDWRLRTPVERLYVNYFERWELLPGRSEVFLERAYLTLFRKISHTNETEILSLHCDPNEPSTAPHYRYKAGPHIHVNAADQPLPHAHFALNHDAVDRTVADLFELTSVMGRGIELIEKQVLPLY